ncbi:S-dihydroxybenzoyltransferase [Dactylella cylindrospora]|nr:S-dihydroxybenzoyltransferase [Dactylella cylindrospora]
MGIVVIDNKQTTGTTHPFEELEYTVSNSEPSLIFIHEDFRKLLPDFEAAFPSIPILGVPSEGINKIAVGQTVSARSMPLVDPKRRALIIYTSGTTSKPKGCVTTHGNILFQAATLVTAWKYSSEDHLIHVLPLHHVHGIINGLTAMLLAGGTVEIYPKFDAATVWRRWIEGGSTMFMAVPTVYSRLNSYFTEKIAGTVDERRAVEGARKLRLVVSGSAALPMSVKQKFKEITGITLLERYGMTEIGMALSCKYENSDGKGRPDGSVGWPLEDVQVRLVKDDGDFVAADSLDEGEIQIKGPNVFKEYWKMPQETSKEFTEDSFFRTGDIAYRDESGAYFIRGRRSVDIIKSGGYKISALDVEREILLHLPNVKEVAVVGVEDEEWGERVAAIIAVENEGNLELKELRNMLRSHLAPYKIPTLLKIVPKIDRNAMGKINKKQLVQKLWSKEISP